MNTLSIEDHVFPRPVEALPEFANAQARRTLAERISAAFGLSTATATTIANSVVDPSAVRKSIGDPADPEVERIAVPGGTLLGIRTTVWSRRVMPDPRNPRTLPSRRHPFAVDPGSAGEDSKFRPIPEPRALDAKRPHLAELEVEIESRHHLNWAAQHAAAYVLSENDWRISIASQGVMEAVWLVSTTYSCPDGTEPATTLTTAEGSSRVTAVHHLLDVRSADVPYESNEAAFRARIRKLNASLETGPDNNDLIALRCEQIPALILVGFLPHTSGATGFSTAVKSLVALRHVDPPKPWGEGPENESLADEVLDEMFRRGLISDTERDYYAGACTKSEAEAAHLSADPVQRAASIVRLLTNAGPEFNEAIRVAVTSQSTRKRITSKLASELATALILRAVAGDPAKTDQIRRYMRHAFGKAVHRETWESTGRDTDQLVKDALSELREAIAAGGAVDAGPASIELSVRASYPLLVSGRLNADRGSSGNPQPDRRTPGEVLDAMRQTQQGIFQLGQALTDFEQCVPLRAVDENGDIRKLKDGGGDLPINDIYLRGEFPPAGKKRAPRPGDTPQDHFHNRVAAFSAAMEEAKKAFVDLGSVTGDDARPLVESQGVDYRACAAWRELLAEIDEELVVWSRTFRRAYGTGDMPSSTRGAAEQTEEPFDETEWDDEDDQHVA
ncbi:hypothetical protein [Burkholderia cenocepacia]|uniref:hypothetical protein n=1 Tax=Burkholderia cenocepacia TaxID=95486 RepID=UPI001CF2E35E|nr:hypothetical protein [Burkholderia cenocepacia]MCA8239088.1 hypothetical protein [Burkholderia cenocepacia]